MKYNNCTGKKRKSEFDKAYVSEVLRNEIETDAIQVCGYNMLLKIYEANERTKGGIILPATTKDSASFQSRIARVIDMGYDAYDEDRFPFGPWCQIGDYITFRGYEVYKQTTINGHSIGYILDDKVVAVIEDPEMVNNLKMSGL